MADIKNLQIKNNIEKQPDKQSEAVPDLGSRKQEQITMPEQGAEQIEQQFETLTPESREGKEGEAPAGSIIAQGALIAAQKEREKKIEDILADGLDDIYLSMPPAKQQEFKIVGERTAKEINKLLETTRVKVKQIIELIKKWLSIIPGVNKFFLEQEAKIKSDKIMELSRKK